MTLSKIALLIAFLAAFAIPWLGATAHGQSPRGAAMMEDLTAGDEDGDLGTGDGATRFNPGWTEPDDGVTGGADDEVEAPEPGDDQLPAPDAPEPGDPGYDPKGYDPEGYGPEGMSY